MQSLALAISFYGLPRLLEKEGRIWLALQNQHQQQEMGLTESAFEADLAIVKVDVQFGRVEAVGDLWTDWFPIFRPDKSAEISNENFASSGSFDTLPTISASTSISHSMAGMASLATIAPNYFDYVGDLIWDYFEEPFGMQLKGLLTRICMLLKDGEGEEEGDRIRNLILLDLVKNELAKESFVRLKGFPPDKSILMTTAMVDKDLILFLKMDVVGLRGEKKGELKGLQTFSPSLDTYHFSSSALGRHTGMLVIRQSTNIEVLANFMGSSSTRGNNFGIRNVEKFGKIVLPILIKDFEDNRSHFRSFPTYLNEPFQFKVTAIINDIVVLDSIVYQDNLIMKMMMSEDGVEARIRKKSLRMIMKKKTPWKIPKDRHVYLTLVAWNEEGSVMQCTKDQECLLSLKLYSDWNYLVDYSSRNHSDVEGPVGLSRIFSKLLSPYYNSKGDEPEIESISSSSSSDLDLEKWCSFSVDFCRSFDSLLHSKTPSNLTRGSDMQLALVELFGKLKGILPMIHKRCIPYFRPVILEDCDGNRHIHILLASLMFSNHMSMVSNYLSDNDLTFSKSLNHLDPAFTRLLPELQLYHGTATRQLNPGVYVSIFAIDYSNPEMVCIAVDKEGRSNLPSIKIPLCPQLFDEFRGIGLVSPFDPKRAAHENPIFETFLNQAMQDLGCRVGLQSKFGRSNLLGNHLNLETDDDAGACVLLEPNVYVNLTPHVTQIVCFTPATCLSQNSDKLDRVAFEKLPIFESLHRHAYGQSSWIMDCYRRCRGKLFNQH